MNEMLAGHVLVDCLVAQGVTHVFGVPGESYLAALDGFHARADRIRFVTCRQEGGAAFMAEAVGKLTGRPGVCFVTRGPGATNASIGVHTAFQDSTPMVLFVGDVAREVRDREAFQELNFLSFFGPSTRGMAKAVERIDDARRIPEAVARAFATAMNGRPGPVVLVLPENMLTERVCATPLPRVEPVRPGVDGRALAQLAARLAQAQRPFVVAGGGGWSPAAAQALERFATRWQLPVGNAFRFQDTFDNAHPNYAGDVGIALNPALAQRLRESDCLLVLGARLGEMTSGSYSLFESPQPRQALLHVHADPEELNRVYRADVALCAGMEATALALDALTPPADAPWAAWTRGAQADYLANLQPQALPGPIDMPAIIASIGRWLGPEAVFTNGAGNFASWLHRFHRYAGLSRGLKTQLAPTNGAMGYGVPAGIAANLVSARPVLTFTGDGDFLMNGQELATAVQHGARTIIVLLNNGMYGTIRMHQEREYPAHLSGSALRNPDFVALAQAYGYAGVRVTQTAQFEPALREAIEREQGTLIEILLDPEVITTRSTLSAIRAASLQKREQ
jgi:acetolactate synthase-1/2/3 large subunit